MDFTSVLDGVNRAANEGGEEDAAAFAAGRRARPGFWRILDRAGQATGIDASRSAYRANEGGEAAPESLSAPADAADFAGASLDPIEIAFELDLDAATSLDDLRVVRRLFARTNHPDRAPAALRERANRRMTLANALIDAAAARLSR